MVDVLHFCRCRSWHGHLPHVTPLLIHVGARSHPEAHRALGAAPEISGTERFQDQEKTVAKTVAAHGPPSMGTTGDKRPERPATTRPKETRHACSWNPPVRIRGHRLVVGSAVVNVDVLHKFLRVRTRLLAAPDHLPRCPHWREPVPARYTPLTGWGLRQDSPTGRRLPDILAGGVVGGLVSTATTHQARESQMELKNDKRMCRQLQR
jgi:hypothetical protein